MIDIVDLKARIEHNTVSENLIIFQCDKQNSYIPRQYLKEYCRQNSYDIVWIEDITEIPQQGLFKDVCNSNVYLCVVDSLSAFEYIPSTNKVWVVCRKIGKKVKSEYSEYIVEVPKMLDWQIKDFISSYCETLTSSQIDELFSYYKDNLFRLENEMNKVNLLGYSKVKSQLFVDVTEYNIFDITNAIIKRDKKSMSNIYNYIESIDVEPFGLVTLLINNFKNVIDIQLSKTPTAESVGMSGKQFWAVKNYSCGFYTTKELVYIFEFLNDIDYQIKSGLLDMSVAVDYIICTILSL